MNVPLHLWLIPLLPFAGFLLNGIFGRRLPKAAGHIDWPARAAGFVCGCAECGSQILWHGAVPSCRHRDLPISVDRTGTLHIDFSFVLDQLSLVMLLVVTGVGFLIHIYSVGYMHDDAGYCALLQPTSTSSSSS